jgi:hypothetical protein
VTGASFGARPESTSAQEIAAAKVIMAMIVRLSAREITLCRFGLA